MALNGNFTGSSSNQYVQPKITWSATQNIGENYSDVTATLTYSRTNSGYKTYGTWSGGITINGTRVSGSKHVSITQNSNTEALTATVRVYHDTDGSKSITISADGGISGTSFSSTSCSATVTLDTIPRHATLVSAPDFTDEDSPTIEFNNPAGSAANVRFCISFDGSKDDIRYRSLPNPNATSGTYTFNFTQAELDTLYAGTVYGSTKRKVLFYVVSTIGSETKHSILEREFTVTDCEPTLEPTVEEHGEASKELKGENPDYIIRYFNYIIAYFNAEAKKGASITSRTVTCGTQTKPAAGNYATFDNVDSNVFVFTIKDNRGHEVEKTITKEHFFEYIKLSCRTTINKDLASDNTANINLTIQGDYYNGTFGLVDNNLDVEYRYKYTLNGKVVDYPTDEEGNETWYPAKYTSSGGEYIAYATISGLDYRGTYTIQTRARDAVYTGGIVAKDEIVKIVPVYDWGENDFNFNVPVHSKGGFTYDIPISQGNIDYMLTSGMYYMGLYAANKPGDQCNGWLEVYVFSDDPKYAYQKYTDYLGNKYERWRNEGVWGPWKGLTVKSITVNISNYTLNWTKSASGMYWTTVTSLASLGLSDHTILGMYQGSWGGFAATSLINPYIQNGELRVMATAPTSPTEYTVIINYQ